MRLFAVAVSVLVVVSVLGSVGPVGRASAQTTTTNATASGPQPSNDPQGGFEALDNVLAFIALVVFGATAMGLASGSMSVAIWGGYLMFAYLALATDINNLVNFTYATVALVFTGIGFKAWRLEGGGEV